ncbi:MAG: molybdopterin-dependent oxidoreductase [Planctomycetota bacterium]|jgi:DMSO/TMAO reductase YedYZ molybdopterin-dependent catalytic subunit
MRYERPSSRREFLASLQAQAGGSLLGSLYLSSSLGRLIDSAQSTSLPGDELLAVLKFEGEARPSFGRATGEGLSGRRMYDLARVDADDGICSNEQFYIRTRAPHSLPLAGEDPWQLRLSGFPQGPDSISVVELTARSESQGALVMECAGNGPHRAFGLLSAAEWSGVPVSEILAEAGVRDQDLRVMIIGNDDHRQSVPGGGRHKNWIFSQEDLSSSAAFLATEMNSKPLPLDHGHPLRLIVPGWYGCSCIKWVEEIRLLPGDVSASAHMRDYAGRTHQEGVPELARDYRPAVMQLAAMPVRVEHRRDGDGSYYRIIGIVWGGEKTTDRLAIRFDADSEYVPVQTYEHLETRSWTVWEHRWQPKKAGMARIELIVQDDAIPTNRLDEGYYTRSVRIKDV